MIISDIPFVMQRPSSLRFLVILLAALVGFAGLIGLIAASTYTDFPAYRQHGFRRITMDHMFNGTFVADHKSIHWVPEGESNVTFYLSIRSPESSW